MKKYRKEFIKTLIAKKEHMTIKEISLEYNMTERQVRNLGGKFENLSLTQIYQKLRKLSEEIKVRNKIVARLIKMLS